MTGTPTRILWLGNCAFSSDKTKATGTWQIAMGQTLERTDHVELSNVTFGPVPKPVQSDSGRIRQWILPQESLGSDGRPSKATVEFVKRLELELRPDLVHVWGTENFGAAMVADGHISAPALLEMQGILFAYAQTFYGGLEFGDLAGCIGPKELLLPWRHLFFRRREYELRGRAEHGIIRAFRHIAVQSEWVRGHIEHENPGCAIHPTGILLRSEFYDSPAWTPRPADEPWIFTSSSGSTSYKGLHVLFRAFARVLRAHPRARLRVAGAIQAGRLPDGYTRWLHRLGAKLGILGSIDWLGPLAADRMADELRAASVSVIPSFAETYCLALAETMVVGTPAVVSFAGAMPELARHGESARFFSPGDAAGCAAQILRVLGSPSEAASLSRAARETGLARNAPGPIVERQLAIYREILG